MYIRKASTCAVSIRRSILRSTCSIFEETVNRNITYIFHPPTRHRTRLIHYSLAFWRKSCYGNHYVISYPVFPVLAPVKLSTTCLLLRLYLRSKPSRGMWKTKTELVTALNYPSPTSFLRKEILYIAYPDHLILSPNPKLFFCVYISTGACREGGPIWLLSGFTHHCFPVSASCINKISKAGGWGWDSWSESAFARRRKPNIVCIIHPVFLVLESNTILRSLPS